MVAFFFWWMDFSCVDIGLKATPINTISYRQNGLLDVADNDDDHNLNTGVADEGNALGQ